MDAFDDEGFKHLANFEKKLMKKKMKLREFDKDERKRFQNKDNFTFVNREKNKFYKAKTIVTQNSDVKQFSIKP